MTNSDELNDTANVNHDSGYYAVDAKRVIQVFEMFQMRPSHFAASGKAGAQGVYYDAKKISEGRTGNKWGHHTPRALEAFCHFTQSENGTFLPWRELVEHRDFYDGKEGAGRRTGNLLLTENHVQLSRETMIETRQRNKLTREQLAEKTALPARFIESIEDGTWATVTKETAKTISEALGIADQTLFSRLTKVSESDDIDAANTMASPSSIGNQRMKKVAFLSVVLGLVLLGSYLFYPTDLNPDENSRQQEDITQLPGCWDWSNGGYVVISADGTAHLGPILASWKADDIKKGLYTINWPSIVDTLTLSDEGDVLSGSNNYGLPISATRTLPQKEILAGTWLWGNGITVNIQNDSIVRGGILTGKWHKAGHQWIIEWPLIDTILLSKDGRNLKAKNQFGSTTAKRNIACNGG